MWYRSGFLLQLLTGMLLPWATQAQDELQLVLTPHLCVVTEHEPLCQTEVSLVVQGGTAQEVCLFEQNQRHSCKLHQPPAVTKFSLKIQSKTNKPFQIKNSQGQLLAAAQLQLVQFQGALKRHNRGYLWNMM